MARQTPYDLETEEGRRELMLNTMGSFALEGMYPSDETLGYARDYVAGRLTPAEIIARLDTSSPFGNFHRQGLRPELLGIAA